MLQALPLLLKGVKTTLLFFSVVLVTSIPLGLFVSLIYHYGAKPIKMLIRAYIYVMRGTPLLLQLMFVFFGLPYIGVRIGRVESAMFAMIINYAAYYAEIFRGGINSIDKEQFEAIQVLGIGKWAGFMKMILPQVFRNVLPSVGNEVISLIKDTSLIYILGLDDLLKVGKTLANSQASMTPFLTVGVIYLLITAVVTFGLRVTENKADYERR